MGLCKVCCRCATEPQHSTTLRVYRVNGGHCRDGRSMVFASVHALLSTANSIELKVHISLATKLSFLSLSVAFSSFFSHIKHIGFVIMRLESLVAGTSVGGVTTYDQYYNDCVPVEPPLCSIAYVVHRCATVAYVCWQRPVPGCVDFDLQKSREKKQQRWQKSFRILINSEMLTYT